MKIEDQHTGMLPLMADFALSVKLWPAWPPEESPVTVSGIVESVEAMICFWIFRLGVFLVGVECFGCLV